VTIRLDPPRQQEFRAVLNPYFSPARMPDCTPASSNAAVFNGTLVTRGFRQIPVVFTPGARSAE
jgi:hypothetical protein